MIGILKDDTDKEGVETFQKKYFPFPLYVDEEQTFYKVLGNRKIYTQKWNIFKMITSFPGLKQRLRRKGNIAGNFKGEGLLQGGVLVVSSSSQASMPAPRMKQKSSWSRRTIDLDVPVHVSVPRVVYQYSEQTGSEVPVHEIENAVLDELNK
jgi:hypothetical protein